MKMFKSFPAAEVERAKKIILEEFYDFNAVDDDDRDDEDDSKDSSVLNSYTSLAGFPVDEQEEAVAHDSTLGFSQEALDNIEHQNSIRQVVEEMMNKNLQLFIRPCTLTLQDQLKVFGKPVTRIGEVLSENGYKILIVGRTFQRRTCCNCVDQPSTLELERFDFVTDSGRILFRCSIYSDRMKINIGDRKLGQFVLQDYVSTKCEEIHFGAMIVEDSGANQVFRFEKSKRHFDVLLYPEQLKVCTIKKWWDSSDFPFLKTTSPSLFGVPFPDDMTPKRRALLFASSFYLYDKYYQKSKTCRIVLGIFVCISALVIVVFIVLQKCGYFSDHSDLKF